ncbi:MAG: penicillin-binding protein activator [Candidatus Pacebacteria bacterium]|nr:penicillin-binding protein activator [Candidatus Paceibacterota bacterium]
MNKTKHIFAIIFLLLIVGLIYYFKGGYTAVKENRSANTGLKVGVILPLSGDLAQLGEEVQKGIELGVEEARKNGYKIDVIYGDDKSNFGADSVSEANKLIHINKVDVVLTLFAEEAKPIIPIVSKSRVPLLVLWDSNRFITEAGPYVFSNGFSTEKAAIKMADYAFNELEKRKIAIVGHIDPWVEIAVESFKKQFIGHGGQITFEEIVPVTTDDYRTTITKLKQTDFDAVYFPLIPPSTAQFLIQAKQLGINTTLLTGDLIPSVVDEAKTSAENVYTTNIFTDEDDALNQKYKDFFGTEIGDSTLVSFGYDGIDSIIKAKNKDSESLATGFLLLYGKKHSADKEERLYQVQKGEQVLIEK